MMVVVSEPLAPSVGADLSSLHRAHYRSLVRLAVLLVDDVGTGEELVQEAFVTVLSKGHAVRDSDKLPAYLRSAVLNGARSHLRKRSVRNRLRPLRPVVNEPSAEAGAVADDERRAVLSALRSLPERQRDVLALRYYLGLPESEIAATLGITAGTVKTHARRGLAALAATLEDRR